MLEGKNKMQKIQYDSFYKFAVSIGVALIIVPVLILRYIVSGEYGLLISAEEKTCFVRNQQYYLKNGLQLL